MRQLTLPGIAEPAPLKDRLFIAVLPPDAVANEIVGLTQQLRVKHQLHGTPFDSKRLHISIQVLGDYTEFPWRIARSIDAIMHRTRLPSCSANFDRVLSLTGSSCKPRRCAVSLRDSAGADGLRMLRSRIATVFGLRDLRASFMPHVTLLYDHKHVDEEAIPLMTWRVTELTLIHSKINRGYLQPYSVLARWPLCGA